MIKVILMDCDGPIIKREKYFSQRLLDMGIPMDIHMINEFFQNEFLLCETGKMDLKRELVSRVKAWGWKKPLDELLDFWFAGEATTDLKMIEDIQRLRKKGVKCFLTTDQEKYRTAYLWETVGLKDVLDKIYSSCDVGFLKRQPEFWGKVLATIDGCRKEEILVWDDDQRALDGAKQAGLRGKFYTNFENYLEIMESEGLHAQS